MKLSDYVANRKAASTEAANRMSRRKFWRQKCLLFTACRCPVFPNVSYRCLATTRNTAPCFWGSEALGFQGMRINDWMSSWFYFSQGCSIALALRLEAFEMAFSLFVYFPSHSFFNVMSKLWDGRFLYYALDCVRLEEVCYCRPRPAIYWYQQRTNDRTDEINGGRMDDRANGVTNESRKFAVR